MAPSLVLPAEKAVSITTEAPGDDDAELVYGFPDESVTNFSRERFPSKMGGKPVFLLGEAFETPYCSSCASKLRFLLQIYAPISENPGAFHRTLYIYVCTNAACTLKAGTDSVVVIRAQLPRRNSLYPYNFGEDKVTATSGIDISVCELCGGKATERCGGCASVQYCSRSCQRADWNLGHKYVCKKEACEDLTVKMQQLHENRSKWLFRQVSLETAVYSDDEDDYSSEEEESESDEEYQPPVSEAPEGETNDRVDGDKTENADSQQEAAENGSTTDNTAHIPEEPISISTDGVSLDCEDSDSPSGAKCASGLGTMQDASAEELPESLFKSRHRSDPVFDRFTRLTSYPPDQVVRYQRGGQVLWMHSAGQLEMPSQNQSQSQYPDRRCSLCSGELTFELQVLPQILYYINPNTNTKNSRGDTRASIGDVAKHLRDGLDWGVIAIWTCAASCTPPPSNNNTSQYVRESHVWLQPAPSAQEFPA